jgi:hypothetical protein
MCVWSRKVAGSAGEKPRSTITSAGVAALNWHTRMRKKLLRKLHVQIPESLRKILSESEIAIASHDIYASDALHVATYSSVARLKRLDAMLSDDRHFERLGEIVNVLILSEASSSR